MTLLFTATVPGLMMRGLIPTLMASSSPVEVFLLVFLAISLSVLLPVPSTYHSPKEAVLIQSSGGLLLPLPVIRMKEL
jgi:hypothetical protein